ncbi:hypothetical protein GCM10010442_51230 [Kitasatospora kifunensis]
MVLLVVAVAAEAHGAVANAMAMAAVAAMARRRTDLLYMAPPNREAGHTVDCGSSYLGVSHSYRETTGIVPAIGGAVPSKVLTRPTYVT